MVYKTPIIVNCSIEGNLAPKIAYLLDVAKFSRELIVDNPVVLTLSLSLRIVPRVRAAHSKGLTATVSMLKTSDISFLRTIGAYIFQLFFDSCHQFIRRHVVKGVCRVQGQEGKRRHSPGQFWPI